MYVVAHWNTFIYSDIVNTFTPCVVSLFGGCFPDPGFDFCDLCGSCCINHSHLWAEERRVGRQTERCLWKFRAFVLSRTPLICETRSTVGLRGGEASGPTCEQKNRSGRAINLLKVWAYGPPKGEWDFNLWNSSPVRFYSDEKAIQTEQENMTLASSWLWLISFSHFQTSSINMSTTHWCLWDALVCCSQVGSIPVPVTPSRSHWAQHHIKAMWN